MRHGIVRSIVKFHPSYSRWGRVVNNLKSCAPSEAHSSYVTYFRWKDKADLWIVRTSVSRARLSAGHGRHDDASSISIASHLSIGTLNTLPLEVLQNIIFDKLDLAGLTTLRATRRGLRSLINEIPKYSTVMTHAFSSVRAALSLEVASKFSGHELYQQLICQECHLCKDFGPFLDLLKFQRVCFNCCTEYDTNLVLTKDHAKAEWLLSSRALAAGRATIAKSVPRVSAPTYGSRLEKKRIFLVNSHSARNIVVQLCGSLGTLLRCLTKHHSTSYRANLLTRFTGSGIRRSRENSIFRRRRNKLGKTFHQTPEGVDRTNLPT